MFTHWLVNNLTAMLVKLQFMITDYVPMMLFKLKLILHLCRHRLGFKMPKTHFVLLANFYGSYLSQSKFDATAIINNAGIEQLATLGKFRIL